MTVKRPLLRASARFVNAVCGFALIFSVAACSNKKDEQDSTVIIDNEPSVQLQVIWSTGPLVGPVRDIAITAGPSPLMLVAYENNQAQLFDLDGDPLIDATDLDLKAVASGVVTRFSGLDIVLFPALESNGVPKLVGYSSSMTTPLALAFPDKEQPLGGICSLPSSTEDTLAKVAFWTEEEPDLIQTGDLYLEEDQILWRPSESQSSDGRQQSCFFLPSGELSVSPHAHHIKLEYPNETIALHREDADIKLTEKSGDNGVSFKPGVTVKAPTTVTAFTGTPKVSVGSYRDGMLVVAGSDATGENRVTFIDPVGLLGLDDNS